MDYVDIVIYRLVHGLDPVLYIDLALKQVGIMNAGQPLDLPDLL